MEQIFPLLRQHFEYLPEAKKAYAKTAGFRFGCPSSQVEDEINTLISNEKNTLKKLLFFQQVPSAEESSGLFKLDASALLTELKRLDLNNQKILVTLNINPEMKKYLNAFIAEREVPRLFGPSSELKKAEYNMLEYLLSQPFDEEYEHVENIANRTLRVILQGWLLCPELLLDKQGASELICGLDLSNCKI